jgi:hypothetical protein
MRINSLERRLYKSIPDLLYSRLNLTRFIMPSGSHSRDLCS